MKKLWLLIPMIFIAIAMSSALALDIGKTDSTGSATNGTVRTVNWIYFNWTFNQSINESQYNLSLAGVTIEANATNGFTATTHLGRTNGSISINITSLNESGLQDKWFRIQFEHNNTQAGSDPGYSIPNYYFRVDTVAPDVNFAANFSIFNWTTTAVNFTGDYINFTYTIIDNTTDTCWVNIWHQSPYVNTTQGLVNFTTTRLKTIEGTLTTNGSILTKRCVIKINTTSFDREGIFKLEGAANDTGAQTSSIDINTTGYLTWLRGNQWSAIGIFVNVTMGVLATDNINHGSGIQYISRYNNAYKNFTTYRKGYAANKATALVIGDVVWVYKNVSGTTNFIQPTWNNTQLRINLTFYNNTGKDGGTLNGSWNVFTPLQANYTYGIGRASSLSFISIWNNTLNRFTIFRVGWGINNETMIIPGDMAWFHINASRGWEWN